MISGEICGVIFFLAKKPTFDQCMANIKKCYKLEDYFTKTIILYFEDDMPFPLHLSYCVNFKLCDLN